MSTGGRRIALSDVQEKEVMKETEQRLGERVRRDTGARAVENRSSPEQQLARKVSGGGAPLPDVAQERSQPKLGKAPEKWIVKRAIRYEWVP